MPIRGAVARRRLFILALSIVAIGTSHVCFSMEPGPEATGILYNPAICLQQSDLEGLDSAQEESRQPSETSVSPKSPLAAGLLGGVVGFGSGQFYSKRNGSGFALLIVDGIFGAILIGGFAILDEADEADSVFGAMGAAGASSIYIAIGSIGLITSHVVQAILGPISATRYNKEIMRKKVRVEPFVAPTGNTVVSGLTLRF